MTSHRDPLAVRLYSRALAILPRGFREDRGPAMVSMLADEWRAAGTAGRVALMMRAAPDLLATALLERTRRAPGSRPGRRGGGGASWLDIKLALRMLIRYPGLTVVAGLALAFAIFVGAGTFEFVSQFVDPRLPLPQGDRLVGLRYWDPAENEEELPVLADLRAWREEFGTVEDLAAFQTVQRSLVIGVDGGEPLTVARMSATGFRAAGVPPLLGRTLLESDEEPGAAPVVVLGHGVWQSRFAGDRGVLGRAVKLGAEHVTVVGVMPEGFRFPKDHEIWAPLTLDSGTGAQAPLRVFGRLAPGVSIEEAQAEASGLAARAAGADPARYRNLRAQVLPHAEALSGIRLGLLVRVMIYQVNVYAALFLILVAANVALLMFARAATREREIVVRSALGASRRRIVTQLFVEALVLGTLATAVGLAFTGPALGWVHAQLREIGGAALPFWVRASLSPGTITYAAALTLLGAAVAGVIPALKATGPAVHSRLRQAAAGAGGLRLGGIWTVIIVTQIAATVVFTGVAWVVVRQAVRSASVETRFPADEYLGVRVEMDREEAVPGSASPGDDVLLRYSRDVLELERQLSAHPAVAGVTISERLPVKSHASAQIEVDDGDPAGAAADRPGHPVFAGAVDLDFFAVMRAALLSGRTFDSRDLVEGSSNVIVNASFVDEVLAGRSAPGRRIRYAQSNGGEPGPWHEIVGVVEDLVAGAPSSLDIDNPPRARVYHPLDVAAAGTYPFHIVAHVPAGVEAVAATLHHTAEAVSPALRLHEVQTLDRANSDLALLWRLWADLVLVVSAVALFLSLAGIYSVMSFTVSRRRREIGVRVALGATASRVVLDIFRAPLTRVCTGVAIGCILVGGVVWSITQGRAELSDAALLLIYGIGMLGICALACVGPTARALRVQPAEALNAED